MSGIPQEVRSCIEDIVLNVGKLLNAEKQVEMAEDKVRKLPDFKQHVEALVSAAIRQTVYDVRHEDNRRIKYDAGVYNRPAKVNPGTSTVVNRTYRSVFDYHIMGVVLGNILGGELDRIIQTHGEIAEGHLKLVRIAEWLKTQRIPANKRVRDVVSEKKLRAQFVRIFGKGAENAA